MKNGNLLKCRVSEIRIKQNRVNQVGVFAYLEPVLKNLIAELSESVEKFPKS